MGLLNKIASNMLDEVLEQLATGKDKRAAVVTGNVFEVIRHLVLRVLFGSNLESPY